MSEDYPEYNIGVEAYRYPNGDPKPYFTFDSRKNSPLTVCTYDQYLACLVFKAPVDRAQELLEKRKVQIRQVGRGVCDDSTARRDPAPTPRRAFRDWR